MPIEDYGSSPTPSGSSSSSATTSSTTRPIKIKKNQGSRSVILFDNVLIKQPVFIKFSFSQFQIPWGCKQQVDTQRVGEEQVSF
jgi:hypothetical protein